MSTATIRRTLREQFGPKRYRITNGGNVFVCGPLPVDSTVVGWYLLGQVAERGIEPLKR